MRTGCAASKKKNKMFHCDAKLFYSRPLAGHELIECRSIYDVVDMCGGWTSRQTAHDENGNL